MLACEIRMSVHYVTRELTTRRGTFGTSPLFTGLPDKA